MPVEPSPLDAPPRFDPRFVTDEDLEDLATFRDGITRESCLERLRSYSLEEMAAAWRSASPVTADELLAFYSNAELYIWELMQWHASPARRPYWETLASFAERYPATAGYRRVCDFGCGVGSDGLFLAARGYDVTLVDVDGPAFRFAQHRFRRRGLPASFRVSTSVLPQLDDRYDAVICFDVLEHLPDPLGAARRLVAGLRDGGILVQQSSFSDDGHQPCHLRSGIEQFGGMRWPIHLARLGLSGVGGTGFRKAGRLGRLVQRSRYRIWCLTGLWVTARYIP